MGIGVLVAVLFGTVTLWQTQTITARILHRNLEQRTLELAHSLSLQLERTPSMDSRSSLDQLLARYLKIFPDLRYIVVRNSKGRVAGDTFNESFPENLRGTDSVTVGQGGLLRVFPTQGGLLFDAVYPILGSRGGQVELALANQTVVGELSVLSRSVIWILLFCAVVGTGLAWVLAHFLTYPIHLLDKAAQTVSEGELSAKAEVFYEDEIGRLAATFNQMTANLQKYRQEILEKEKSRLSLLDKIVRAQEEERRSISRELHDQMGQSLSAILLNLQSDCLYRSKPRSRCQLLEGKLRELIDQVRRLAWNMRPSILDDYGLDSALARYAEEMSLQSGVSIDYQYLGPPGRPRLPGQVETTFYRIAQEAVTNVVRHATATRASIVIIYQPDNMTLLVEDNGRGFNTAGVNQGGFHFLGITGMKERAGLVGGTCIVESEPGKGTVVRIQIPLVQEVGSCLSAS